MVSVEFIETDNDLTERRVLRSSFIKPHGVLRGLVRFAHKRYGKGGYTLKPDSSLHGGYIVANDGRTLTAKLRR